MLKQEHTSADTCVNQVPAAFKKIEWKPGTVNLDFGGGKYDTATKYLRKFKVKNIVCDRYNHPKAAKSKYPPSTILDMYLKAIDECLKKPADTATLCNVLNVIKEDAVRVDILGKLRLLVKPGGKVYISCYRGEGDEACETCNGWQENRPYFTYLAEVRRVFPDATLKDGMIVATVPKFDKPRKVKYTVLSTRPWAYVPATGLLYPILSNLLEKEYESVSLLNVGRKWWIQYPNDGGKSGTGHSNSRREALGWWVRGGR